MLRPLGSTSCTARRYHRPTPLTVEQHHVVPQAWQHFALGKEALIDPRTVALCPTCHRNVHFYIVALMKERPIPRRGAEVAIARLALARWVETGRTLAELRAHKLYGAA